MLALIWRTIKNRKNSLIAYSIGAVIFMWMFVLIYPLFAESQVDFDKLLQAYPPEIFDAFGMDLADFTLTNFESFVGVEYFSIMWPILVIIFVISFGGAQIAGEIEKGTIEIILAQPISRLKIFFGKYLAGVASIVAFCFVSIFSVVPLAELYGVEYRLQNYWTVSILGFLFALAIFSLSMLATSIFSEKGKSNFTVGGIIAFMYIINIISGFKESIEDLKYLSFFHYFDYSPAILENKIDSLTVWVFFGVSVVATALAAFWFMRRDISV